MATQVGRQAAARARRPAVSACVSIPASKITAPGVPDSALTRPRITRLIARGTRWCPLTAVTAPAGAGKTMALALWAAAYGGLAEGRAAAAAQIMARARSGWSVPAWLGQKLSLVESRAYAAAGDIQAALAAAGDARNASRALTPVLATDRWTSERVRLQAWLVDAQLGYDRSDRTRGRRSLASALRLAEREQLRRPFVIERSWIWPELRHAPERFRAHRRLLTPTLRRDQLPAPQGAPDRAPIPTAGPLTEREREVLRHVSGLLSTPEAASEMHISANTVKTHLTHIYRKLATTRRGEAVRRARQLDLMSHCSRPARTFESHPTSAVRYSPRRLACTAIGSRAGEPSGIVLRPTPYDSPKGLRARALRESSPPSLPLGAWGNRMCGCPEVFRGSGHGYQDLA